MLVQCWASVVDGGPTLDQHRVDVSPLLGSIICSGSNMGSQKYKKMTACTEIPEKHLFSQYFSSPFLMYLVHNSWFTIPTTSLNNDSPLAIIGYFITVIHHGGKLDLPYLHQFDIIFSTTSHSMGRLAAYISVCFAANNIICVLKCHLKFNDFYTT